MAAKNYLSPNAYRRYQEFNDAIKMVQNQFRRNRGSVYRDKQKNGKSISVKVVCFNLNSIDPTIKLMWDYKCQTLPNRITRRRGCDTHYIFE